MAEKELGKCNITKLGLVMNYSCWQNDILKNSKRAILMTEKTISDA